MSDRNTYRAMKRDALATNRAEGCRCPNVRARVKHSYREFGEHEVTVVTEPHRNDCPLRLAAAELDTGTGTPLAVPPGAPPVPPRSVDTSGLWTP